MNASEKEAAKQLIDYKNFNNNKLQEKFKALEKLELLDQPILMHIINNCTSTIKFNESNAKFFDTYILKKYKDLVDFKLFKNNRHMSDSNFLSSIKNNYDSKTYFNFCMNLAMDPGIHVSRGFFIKDDVVNKVKLADINLKEFSKLITSAKKSYSYYSTQPMSLSIIKLVLKNNENLEFIKNNCGTEMKNFINKYAYFIINNLNNAGENSYSHNDEQNGSSCLFKIFMRLVKKDYIILNNRYGDKTTLADKLSQLTRKDLQQFVLTETSRQMLLSLNHIEKEDTKATRFKI